ncbi:MAG: DUF1648 domain-containing protein [Halapricum sp.]
MPVRRSDLVATGLLAATALAGVVLWNDLPAEMAIHFDASGTPDNYVDKPLGVLLAPAIGFGAIWFTRLSARADPSADPRVIAGAVYFVGGLIAYVQALVLAYNLGHRFSMTTALVPVFVASAVLVVWAVYRER